MKKQNCIDLGNSVIEIYNDKRQFEIQGKKFKDNDLKFVFYDRENLSTITEMTFPSVTKDQITNLVKVLIDQFNIKI